MPTAEEILRGKCTELEAALSYLREDLFPKAVRLLNEETLPFQCSRFDSDVVPSNQRNLTDVRTRMGMLLEYELGKAIASLLPDESGEDESISLTYVIANKFPDLALRDRTGNFGIRFEVKALQTIAEEKSANFDTLLKDIRKGTDFVVVLLWEWEKHTEHSFRYPLIRAVSVLDAYQLAQMRDTYWLNSPPAHVAPGRQGYDLTFGVNCRKGKYNREEGNHGKLMRIFDPEYEGFLPADVASGTTLAEYYKFTALTYRLGLSRVGEDLAGEVAGATGTLICHEHPRFVVFNGHRGDKSLLFIGAENRPEKAEVLKMMKEHGSSQAMLLNGKFNWWVVNAAFHRLDSGDKPHEASKWIKEHYV